MLKQLFKNYQSPTPAKWRKIGDTLLVVGGTITTYLIDHDNHLLAKIALGCTIAGKVITNLATEKTPDQQ